MITLKISTIPFRKNIFYLQYFMAQKHFFLVQNLKTTSPEAHASTNSSSTETTSPSAELTARLENPENSHNSATENPRKFKHPLLKPNIHELQVVFL